MKLVNFELKLSLSCIYFANWTYMKNAYICEKKTKLQLLSVKPDKAFKAVQLSVFFYSIFEWNMLTPY